MTVKAKRAIVAVPPALAARIYYEPLLPFQRDQLTQRYGQGTLTKVAAVYDRPFWRDDGLTGQAVDTGGPVSATFDDSPPTATSSNGPGIIFGFVGGDNARSYSAMSPAARRAAVLNQYAKFFGAAGAEGDGLLRDVLVRRASGRAGCPVGIPSTGTLLAYGPWLRQPVGRIHWAGTETSNYWNGYMDGAVRSGERAAAEVLHEPVSARRRSGEELAFAGLRGQSALLARGEVSSRELVDADARRDRGDPADAERVPLRCGRRPRSRRPSGPTGGSPRASGRRCSAYRSRSRTTPTWPGETTAVRLPRRRSSRRPRTARSSAG